MMNRLSSKINEKKGFSLLGLVFATAALLVVAYTVYSLNPSNLDRINMSVYKYSLASISGAISDQSETTKTIQNCAILHSKSDPSLLKVCQVDEAADYSDYVYEIGRVVYTSTLQVRPAIKVTLRELGGDKTEILNSTDGSIFKVK